MAKTWQSRPPQGSAITLPNVIELSLGPDPGTMPRVIHVGLRRLVHYSRSRLFLDRDAWELLERPDDVLVQRIRPTHEPAFTVALTKSELESVFGSVRQTRSWDEARCYHFPNLPPAVDSFRVAQSIGSERISAERVVAASPLPPTHRPSADECLEPPSAVSSQVSQWAKQWANRVGGRAESPQYLANVAQWRDYWRPSAVRVLLVAESHVGEMEGDTDVTVAVPDSAGQIQPTSFCRFVYCLGYGEDGICSPRPLVNGGTWQFWDIFGAIAGGSKSEQPRKLSSSLRERLQWKMDVLAWLSSHGVWLVDASVAGIYRPGGGKVAMGKLYEEMLRESYEHFVWPSVCSEPLEQIWVIGLGVRHVLEGHLSMRMARTIIQPQGDRSEPGRHQRELYELVRSVRQIIPARA